MERLYKVFEVAKMLNVSGVAVRKWIEVGKLRARRIDKLGQSELLFLKGPHGP